MISKIEADDVYTSSNEWLTSRFLFSFADYYDPTNMSWGRPRVFNDDTIAPYSGFPPHSHREMEIVTIINSGTLTHTDSMGNSRSISDNYVQRMSAGTGVTHSEMNDGVGHVSLYQLWFTPRTNLNTPSYEEKEFTPSHGLTLLVSPEGENGSVSISADVKIYKAVFKTGETLTLPITPSDHVLVYVTSGKLTINNQIYTPRDQARIIDKDKLEIIFDSDSEIVIVVA